MSLSEFEALQLKLKEKELDLKVQELASEQAKRLTPVTTAFIAAVAAVLGAATGAWLQGVQNAGLERQKYEFNKEIERQKLESSLILQAVSTGKQTDSVKNLRFLVRLNLIAQESLRKDLTELLDKAPEETAVLPAASVSDLLKQGVDNAKRGSLDDAIKFYEKVLEQDPKNASALNFMGYALLKLGRTDDAIARLEQGVKISPTSPWIYYNLAIAYFEANRGNNALDAAKEAVRLDPKFKDIIKRDQQFRRHIESQPALRSLVNQN